MNINPISFKGITKIIGTRPLASADRISDIIKHNEKGETKTEQKIARYFSSKETQGSATSVTFNNGKTAYVVTGSEYEQLKDLYDDMAYNVSVASAIYGKGSDMVKLVTESEMDRYIDLAKSIVVNQEDATFRVGYDDLTNNINSLDLIL